MKKVIMSFEVELSKYKKNIISLSKINYEKISESINSIPKTEGIYIVCLNKNEQNIEVSETTTATKCKKLYTIDDLKQKLLTCHRNILYIGKANSKDGLRGRIRLLLRYSIGKTQNHDGGKALWQIKNWNDKLDLYWCETSNSREIEQKLLVLHSKEFPNTNGDSFCYPFANWQR